MLDPDGLPLGGAAPPRRLARAGRARAARRRGAARPRLAGRGRPRHAAAARHRHPRERRRAARRHRPPLRRRRRAPPAAGAAARHRRRPRRARLHRAQRRPRARGVPHATRATPGSSGSSASRPHRARGSRSPRRSQVVRAGTVFTTHTPVPAGIDRFDARPHRALLLHRLLPGRRRRPTRSPSAPRTTRAATTSVFNMAVMGLRLAQRANGVSKLHGEVSRAHVRRRCGRASTPTTCRSPRSRTACTRRPGPTRALGGLAESTLGTADTEHADWASGAVTDAELWGVQRRMRQQLVERRASPARRGVERAAPGRRARRRGSRELLDPDVLTIGFARRVPTYKRLTLMLHDPERLRALLTHPERPVQLVIAGKSHPADDEGKRLIQQLVRVRAAARACASASCSCPTTTSAWPSCSTRAATCG